jgi:hypothetical protein
MMFRIKNKMINGSRQRSGRVVKQHYGNVFSYHSARAKSDAPFGRAAASGDEANRKQGIGRLTLLPGRLALAAILISTVYLLVLDTEPKVITGENAGSGLLRSEQTYRQTARQFLGKSLTSRSKISVDTKALSRHLEQQYPEIRKASVALPFAGHRPIIRLTAARPALVLSSVNGQFVLTDQGRVIINLSDANRAAISQLPIVTDESGLGVDSGDRALSKVAIDFIQTLNAQLTVNRSSPEIMTLQPSTSCMCALKADLTT